MFSILNDVFRTATGQRRYDPPDHWIDRPSGPRSGYYRQAADRQRRTMNRAGLR